MVMPIKMSASMKERKKKRKIRNWSDLEISAESIREITMSLSLLLIV